MGSGNNNSNNNGSSNMQSSPTRSVFGGGGFNEETSSMVSDMSYTMEGSWMKKLSTTFGGSDASIDDMLRDFYGDSVLYSCLVF